jgi:hypothetical protein
MFDNTKLEKKTHLKSLVHSMSHFLVFFLFWGQQGRPHGVTMFFIFWTKTGKTLGKKKIGINLVNFSIFGNLCHLVVYFIVFYFNFFTLQIILLSIHNLFYFKKKITINL